MKSEWEQIREVLESLRAFEHDRTLDEQMSKKLAGKPDKVLRQAQECPSCGIPHTHGGMCSGGPMVSTVQDVLDRRRRFGGTPVPPKA